MKKSNYLHYLNQYQTKIPIDVEKTFKNNKKQTKMVTSKTLKTKIMQQKISHHQINYQQTKQLQNKQNLHPNVLVQANHQSKQIKNNQPNNMMYSHYLQSKQKIQIPKIQLLQTQINHKPQQFQLSLKRCNFEPNHSSSNLFLIETQTDSQLIVCQKCSQRFSKRTRISSIQQKPTPKHSYAQMIMLQQELEKYNKKLKRVNLIQKQNVRQTLNKIEDYYNNLIKSILQARHQIESSIMQIYQKNEIILSQLINKNESYIKDLQSFIQGIEKKCIQGINKANQYVDQNKINQILLSQYNNKIQLSCINVQIPLDTIQTFENWFKQSKYYISLLKYSPKQQNQINIQSKQVSQINQQTQYKTGYNYNDKLNNMDLSPDFEKQIPFNVQYSPSQSKQYNFSNKINQQLSRVPSSEQLLIQSLRNHQNYQQYQNENKNNLTSQKHQIFFNTQASTQRIQQIKEESSYGKRNFVKQLHIQQNDIDDLMCDQDLTLSNSHPIYQSQIPFKPRKSLKLIQNSLKMPLTLNELTNNQSIHHQSFTNKLQIPQVSVISSNQNKHEISFQLDQNIIIDANILPCQDNYQQNLDIISPAFKII